MVRKTAQRFLALALAAYSIAMVGSLAHGLTRPVWAVEPGGADPPVVIEFPVMVEPTTPPSATPPSATPPSATPPPATPLSTTPLSTAEYGAPPIEEFPPVLGTGEDADNGWGLATDLEANPSEVTGSVAEPELEVTTPEDTPEDTPGSEPSAAMAGLLRGLSPDQVKRSQLLMEADRHLLAGDRAAADVLYRQAKEAKWLAEMTSGTAIIPITDPEELPAAGRVYWREAQAGLESGFPNRVLVPLELLVKDYPEFLPAQSLYVRYLIQQERMDEARQLLEAVALRFPYHPDVLRAEIQLQMAQEQWIEAAITANQFALLNPDHPDAAAMEQLAQDNFNRFRGQVNANLTRNLVGNIITGAASYFLTGGLFGPFTAINSGILLMQGESALGQQVADQVKRQLPIVTDPEVRNYVNDIGHKLAALAGRDEFNYTFEVVMDDSLNAFALPGGKIFINAGAITNSYSEAELAGLLGHEISHAVLSHGFQMVTQGNLTASLAAFIPIPEVANLTANLIVAGYSRDMERQSDILGTKLLSTGHYAADGLHNLMATLEETYGNRGVTWFSSHPNPRDRINYLKQLIDQGGFDRYAYEGVEKHLAMRQKTIQLINEYRLEQGRPDKIPIRR
ncbi:M48 family metalloprotease [Phormidium sp. FACHB-1136]|uniref:M48 family metalloprotease n=1 Tax=Phormidium sp. FACHB-1136 TaxID=2692848 RepID=UPI0018EFF631